MQTEQFLDSPNPFWNVWNAKTNKNTKQQKNKIETHKHTKTIIHVNNVDNCLNATKSLRLSYGSIIVEIAWVRINYRKIKERSLKKTGPGWIKCNPYQKKCNYLL